MENRLHTLRSAVRNWWVHLLIGIGLIVLGIWVFRNPGGTLLGLATLFNAMLLVSGLATIGFALSNRDNISGWGWTLAGGVMEMMLAIVLFRHPAITGLALNFLLGFWLMFRGFYLVSIAFEIKSYKAPNWGWILVGGILTTVLAACVLLDPLAGAVTIAIWAGLSLIFGGVFNIMLALALRRVNGKMDEAKGTISEIREG